MKKYLFALLTVLLVTSTVSAELVTPSVSSEGAKVLNSHRYGILSLDVYVPSTDTADAYSPYTDTTPIIGGKYFLLEHTAIEVGLEFDIRGEKEEYSEYLWAGTHVGLYGAYVRYFAKKRISPYVKAGAAIALNTGDRYDNNAIDQDEMDFSIIGGFGTEFFVTKELSISAEALIRLQLSPAVHFETVTPAIKASFYFDNFL